MSFKSTHRCKLGANHVPAMKCKYKEGDLVIGRRSPNQWAGTFVRSYITINPTNGWRNPAYIVKCDIDGKERSFQCLSRR